MAVRRPEKTPPRERWETDEYIIELHHQTIGWVVWTFQKFGAYKDRVWEYAAYETIELAYADLLENYLPAPEPCRPASVEEIPACPEKRCGMKLIVVPDGGCGARKGGDGWSCPVISAWPHNIDQSGLNEEDVWIRYGGQP